MSKKSSSSALYPDSETFSKKPTSSSSLYPSLDNDEEVPITQTSSITLQPSIEETLLIIPGSMHLISKPNSLERVSGDLTIVRLRQGDDVIAIFFRIGHDIQLPPLSKKNDALKNDQSHYLFILSSTSIAGEDDELVKNCNNDRVDYGLTIASKGQDHLLKEFDEILEKYSNFHVREIKASEVGEDVAKETEVGEDVVQETPPLLEAKKEMMKDTSAAYLTTLAPNVEDYSSGVARAIASGSGSLIKGILWCGDVTADRLQLGHEFLRSRMAPCSEEMQLRPATMQAIKSAKSITKMLDQVTKGYFPEVLGFSTSAVVNSSVGKKYLSHLPGEIVLASLDGFNRVFDAVEVAGKNVMSTTSTVTTGLVSHRYGEQAAGATNEGLDAAGHVIGIALTIGTAWAFSKIRKVLNQQNFVRPTTLGKGAAKAVAAGAKSKSK